MSLLSYVPGQGPKTTKEKLQELEEEAGSLPIIFGVFITKVFENIVIGRISLALNFLIAALATGLIYVYSREIRKAAESAAEKVQDNIEEE